MVAYNPLIPDDRQTDAAFLAQWVNNYEAVKAANPNAYSIFGEQTAAAYRNQLNALGYNAGPTTNFSLVPGSGGAVTVRPEEALPPMPHPDASDLSLGPNLGGADAVTFAHEVQPTAPSTEGYAASGTIIVIVGLGILAIILLGRKKQ